MAFLVCKTFNNGYRCCCHSTSDDDGIWYQSKEEALRQVPLFGSCGDYDLERIQVYDGQDGSLIAEGQLEWVRLERGQGYQYYRWYGYSGENKFEAIHGGNPGESWEDLNARLVRERHEKQLAEQTKKLADLQALTPK